MPATEEYLLLEFPGAATLDIRETGLIKTIQGLFSTRDLKMRTAESGLQVYLRRLDLERLASLIASADLPPDSVLYTMLERIAAIGSYGVRGGKRIYVGYDRERKVAGRKHKARQRQPFFYSQDHGFSRDNNHLPPDFINRIVCADSEEFLKRVPDNSIDLVFTSPPYNFGLEYTAHPDASHWEAYFAKLFSIFRECIRVTKYGGRILINVQPLFSDYIPSHHLISQFFIQNRMLWKGEIIWEKNNYNCKYTAWGSWKSPSSPYLKYSWEFIEIFCKGELQKKGDTSRIDISAEEFKQWVFARWSIAPERRMKEYGHPAMFPEQLAERALKLFSYQDDIILDPFNGAGTTSAVAARLGRRYLGIDTSEEYCDRARQRLNGLGFSRETRDL